MWKRVVPLKLRRVQFDRVDTGLQAQLPERLEAVPRSRHDLRAQRLPARLNLRGGLAAWRQENLPLVKG